MYSVRSYYCTYFRVPKLDVAALQRVVSQAKMGTDRVSDLEPGAGFETRDELSIQTGGIEGQGQLLRDSMKLQLYLGTNFLGTAVKENGRRYRHVKE